MTLSKSSTLTKCARPAWDRRRCPFRQEGAGNVHAFDRKRPSRATKGRGAKDAQSFFFRIKSSAIRAFGGCLGSKRR